MITDELQQGVLTEVTLRGVGSETSVAHLTGDTHLYVYDSTDFSDDGGQLRITVDVAENYVLTYLTKDDDLNMVTLSAGVPVDVDPDTLVMLEPQAPEKWASVQLDEDDEPILARIPYSMASSVDEGIRDPTEYEGVEVQLKGLEYIVTDFYGKEDYLDGSALDPTTIPVSGSSPISTAPVLAALAGLDSVFLTWGFVAPDTTYSGPVYYEVHASTVAGFTPDSTTLYSIGLGPTTRVAQMPNGTKLSTTNPTRFKIRAFTSNQVSPWSNEASATALAGADPAVLAQVVTDVNTLNTVTLPGVNSTVTTLQAKFPINTADIADGAVLSAKIGAGQITNPLMATGAVGTANVQASAITSALISDGTIATGDVAASAITSALIANGTIVTGDIGADQITSALIAASTIATSDIGADQIVSALIAAGTIATSDIGSAQITTGLVANLAITAPLIADATITTAKYGAGTVTNTVIADDSVTSAKIVANTIVAADIAANTITASQIASATITATQIAAGTITATQIAANSITTGKLTISNLSNLANDPGFELGGLSWTLGSASIVTIADPNNGGTQVAQNASAGALRLITHSVIACQPAEVYYMAATVRKTTTGTTGTVSMDANFTLDGASSSVQTAWSATMASLTQNVWVTKSGYVTVPAAKNQFLPRLVIPAPVPAGDIIQWDDIVIRKVADAQLIVDGSITAGKIAASTITGSLIAATTIAGSNIIAGTITSSLIAAGTIVAGNIAAGTITGSLIAATTITGSNLVANTITAAQIAASTITANEIAANTITAADIAALTITGAQIAAVTISAAKMVANTITAAQIAATTITAAQIAANTITAAQIAAGTITATEIAAGTITASQLSATAIDGLTITGATIRTASSGSRTEIANDTSAGVIKFYTGLTGEVAGFINPGMIVRSPDTTAVLNIQPPKFSTGYTIAPTIMMRTGGTGSLFDVQPVVYIGIPDSPKTGGGTQPGLLSIGKSTSSVSNIDIDTNGNVDSLGHLSGTKVLATSPDTTTSAANVRHVSGGQFQEVTSLTQHKISPTPIKTERLKKLLDLTVVEWYDRAEFEANKKKTKGLKRIPGVLAEEVEAIDYGFADHRDGELRGVAYDRLGLAMIPLVKELYQELDEMKKELAALKAA
jgi:hypothetical protein